MNRHAFDHGETALSMSAVSLRPLELTVVVPTFNEAENVPLLVERLARALVGIEWEVVFVDDDSPDGTSEVVHAIAARDRRVRIIRRVGRRGLSAACVEGMLSSSAPYLAVMDGDLQHDESVLGKMYEKLHAERLDIVVASRFKGGERTEGLSSWRKQISRSGKAASHLVLNADLSDPMSGFFAMTRAAFDETVQGLSQQGFKILLDIFASADPPLTFAEVPCEFRPRQHGASKLDTMAAWDFGVLILDKLIGRFVPARFVIFGLVGMTGLAVHLLTLRTALAVGISFATAQASAVVAAMTWNFFLNNVITYRDRRLRGIDVIKGLAAFYAIGTVGAVANVSVAAMLFDEHSSWWFAGIAGAFMGMAWNYTMSSFFTWRGRTS